MLMQTMKSQCLKNKLDPNQKSPYKRLINYIGPPEGLIPMLGNPSDVSPFVYATPAMLGNLVPMIEFYYSDGKKDGTSGEKRADQKILFSDYMSAGDRTHKYGTGPRAFTPEGARAEVLDDHIPPSDDLLLLHPEVRLGLEAGGERVKVDLGRGTPIARVDVRRRSTPTRAREQTASAGRVM